MEKFGFSLSKARVIDYDRNDRRIAEYILEHEPSFRACIECGACAATCTAGSFTEFSLREFNILVKRGENDRIVNRLKDVCFAGKCHACLSARVNTKECDFLAQKLSEYCGYEFELL